MKRSDHSIAFYNNLFFFSFSNNIPYKYLIWRSFFERSKIHSSNVTIMDFYFRKFFYGESFMRKAICTHH